MCFSFVAVQTGHLIRGLKLGLEVFLLAYNILFRLFILVFFINNNMRLWNENLWKKQLLYQNLNLFFCLFLKIWALFLFVNKIRISMGLFTFLFLFCFEKCFFIREVLVKLKYDMWVWQWRSAILFGPQNLHIICICHICRPIYVRYHH